jgi:hypothetical protein
MVTDTIKAVTKEENAPLGGKRPIFLAKDPPIAR